MRSLTASQTVEFAFSLSQAPDALPTGQLKIGTTDDAATVTIAADSGSSNGYTASVTLPGTETTADVIRCRIDYTVSSTSYSSYLVLGVIETTNSALNTAIASVPSAVWVGGNQDTYPSADWNDPDTSGSADSPLGRLHTEFEATQTSIANVLSAVNSSGTTTAEDIDERLTFRFPRNGSGTTASNSIKVNTGFDGTIAFDLDGVLEEDNTLASVTSVTASATTGSITFSNLRLHTNKRKLLADTTAITDADTYTITATIVTATSSTRVYKGTLVAS